MMIRRKEKKKKKTWKSEIDICGEGIGEYLYLLVYVGSKSKSDFKYESSNLFSIALSVCHHRVIKQNKNGQRKME